jgi:hypothetical protein
MRCAITPCVHKTKGQKKHHVKEGKKEEKQRLSAGLNRLKKKMRDQ